MSPGRKITIHTMTGGETPDFYFLGVVSAEPDYRLSVLMNRHLGTDLRKNPEDITLRTGSGSLAFSRFTSVPPQFSLVSNRCEGTMLIRKLKNIDFLFLSYGLNIRQKAEELAATIREIPEVTAVFVFDSREISDRNLPLLAL